MACADAREGRRGAAAFGKRIARASVSSKRSNDLCVTRAVRYYLALSVVRPRHERLRRHGRGRGTADTIGAAERVTMLRWPLWRALMFDLTATIAGNLVEDVGAVHPPSPTVRLLRACGEVGPGKSRTAISVQSRPRRASRSRRRAARVAPR
jgi:hypothetical protein